MSSDKKAVYICHTFYHAYVAIMKELLLPKEEQGRATLLLSTMSNDFGKMKDRAAESGVFRDVYFFDELPPESSEEVMRYKHDRGNLVANLRQRIRYTKLLGKLQEGQLPVDLSAYSDIYVFCDSDPIGYYLNYKKLRYHALEDGLNSGKLDNQAMLSNKGAWGIKKFLAKRGLIFIECGYSRYCIDYEVNDLSANYMPPKCAFERSFDSMWEALKPEDHEILARIFIEDFDSLKAELASSDKPAVMILTEPLCDLDTRKRLFGDIIHRYDTDHRVIIKPHPRDLLDYREAFPDVCVMSGRFPMEVINDIPGLSVDKLVSVITQVDNIRFAKECVYLGEAFLDDYEDPAIHRKMELLKAGK